ncbi:hypothetical protein DL765_007421 [Monosporascus sp. GIB2]|nr:hypothetical protein DL765_007421 [Monosporascus sp. GIB2]
MPTWGHREPEEFRAAAGADLGRYGSVAAESVDVEGVRQREEDGLFEATAGDRRTRTGKEVIRATGVEHAFPGIPGYAECWVSGIFYCLYYHGQEERGAASGAYWASGDTGAVVPALRVARQAPRMADEIAKFAKAPERARIPRTSTTAWGGTRGVPGSQAEDEASEARCWRGQLGLEPTPAGTTIRAHPPSNQTSALCVFAVGDCAGPMRTATAAPHSGMCTGGSTPSRIQAESYGQRAMFWLCCLMTRNRGKIGWA